MKVTELILVCALIVGGASRLHAQPVEVAERSIADEARDMAAGRVTSEGLVKAYLSRIEAYDQKGPALNALITLNPNALNEARALDRERRTTGPRGPLHGVPVIVKDNYSTADLQTTAGTLALLGFVPDRDAFQVRKLREAGAVIIGKSNLHELASGITTVGSAFGAARNPYDPTRTPGGSSGGTAAAVAASFAAAGMGSDTCGSIRVPAAFNNLFGLRPTKGLSSIAGIVPLSTTQDVGGPLARTVADLAVMLDATVGEDPADPATHLPPGVTRPRFMDALAPQALKGARIGVLEPLFGDGQDDAETLKIVRSAIEALQRQGATLVPVVLPELPATLDGSSVINAEFREDLATYLAANKTALVRSLDEIVRGGLIHTALEPVLTLRVASKGRDSDEYRIALAKRALLQLMIRRLMDDQKLDALAYPTIRRPPSRIGDPQAGGTCQLSASTGFPALSMPAGFTQSGLPAGVELLGRAFDDAKLVSYAYAYEQAAHPRRAPARTPALAGRSSPPVVAWAARTEAPGTHRSVSARFSFDPSTSRLTYHVEAAGFAEGEILAATLHRASGGGNGPVLAVLSAHGFRSLSGSEVLTDPDRAKMMSGELYLRIATRAKIDDAPRLALRPPPTN